LSGDHTATPPVILVVDDEEAIRKSVARTLSRAGAIVLSAGSGEEALEILARSPRPCDMVITDAMMPGLTGPALIRLLRASGDATPALVVSAYPGGHIPDDMALPEGVEWMEKPFTPVELLERVTSTLSSIGRRFPFRIPDRQRAADG
jgi:two-component system cell cycle sensor histidine kinase/response regulator CckA